MYKRWEPQKNPITARRVLKWLKKAKTWQLILVLIIIGFITATFLRFNNIGMIEKTEAVLAADKELDDAQTKKALLELQSYVTSHMNSDMNKGIVLENTFRRDYDAAVQEAANARNTNSDVYQQASVDCRSRFRGNTTSFREDYVTCVANAVASLPENQQSADFPRVENYRYNFASPLISVDFAGFFTLIFILLTLFILLRLILLYTLKFIVKRRAKVL